MIVEKSCAAGNQRGVGSNVEQTAWPDTRRQRVVKTIDGRATEAGA